MGAAQLLQAIASKPGFCAVAAESPFAGFREISYRVGEVFHAGSWVGRFLLRPMVEVALSYANWRYGLDLQKISPEDSVAKSPVPVLLIHGVMDRNIPLRHSRRIQARNPHIVLWEVPNAGHCGLSAPIPISSPHGCWHGLARPVAVTEP